MIYECTMLSFNWSALIMIRCDQRPKNFSLHRAAKILRPALDALSFFILCSPPCSSAILCSAFLFSPSSTPKSFETFFAVDFGNQRHSYFLTFSRYSNDSFEFLVSFPSEDNDNKGRHQYRPTLYIVFSHRHPEQCFTKAFESSICLWPRAANLFSRSRLGL